MYLLSLIDTCIASSTCVRRFHPDVLGHSLCRPWLPKEPSSSLWNAWDCLAELVARGTFFNCGDLVHCARLRIIDVLWRSAQKQGTILDGKALENADHEHKPFEIVQHHDVNIRHTFH